MIDIIDVVGDGIEREVNIANDLGQTAPIIDSQDVDVDVVEQGPNNGSESAQPSPINKSPEVVKEDTP